MATARAHRSLFSRSFTLLLLAILGGFVNLHLLFAVVPKYVTTGGAGTVGAGMVTGTLMAATVLTQPLIPRVTARIGYPATLATGLALLGVPALFLPLSPALPPVLGISLVRGLGFGTITVTGSALTAELLPAERRGTGMGLYGMAVGVPGIVALPLGVWLADHIGYPTVFVAAGLAPVAALAAAAAIRAPRPATGVRRMPVLAGLRAAQLARPFLILCAATAATGIVKTFLPLAVPAALGALASAALFAQVTAVTIARVLAGFVGDRVGAARLLVPGTVLGAAGMLGLTGTASPLTLLAGAALFGLGAGVIQTVTLVLMFGRVSRSAYGSVSAQWNIAFDGGTGLGAALFGVVVGELGYGLGFALTAGVLCVAAGVAVLDRVRMHMGREALPGSRAGGHRT